MDNLKMLTTALDWMHYGRPENVEHDETDLYEKYEIEVKNKAAYSIGCDPSDLDFKRLLIIDMYLDLIGETEASRRLENALQDECYFYTHVKPFGKAPF